MRSYLAAGLLALLPLGLPSVPLAQAAPAAPMTGAPVSGAPVSGVAAKPLPAVSPNAATLTLDSGSGRVLNLSGTVANVFVADPKVAEVRPASPTTLFVFGTAPGRTTLAAMDANGRVVAQYELTVRPSAYGAGEAIAAIGRALPGSHVRVETTGNGLSLSGQVANADEAEHAMSIARAFVTDKQVVENRLTLASSIQVALRVRIAEMSRTVSREIGINWAAVQGLGKYAAIGLATANPVTASTSAANVLAAAYSFGNNSFESELQALATDNLVHMLAEPTLTTVSGQPASFLVGGEFPIPVAVENNTISVVFKQYGVNLSFVPTVLNDRHISIHVRPEVSQLTSQGAVQLATGNSSISVPALTIRRADTTVEVGSGDSFAIAGLLQDNVTHAVSALPGLGEIPILGALFRSDSFQRNESELVIIVTPYIVRPVSNPAALHLPDEKYIPPSDIERILLLRQVGRIPATSPTDIPGSAGFIVQ